MTTITRDQNASQFNDRVHETVLFSRDNDYEEVEMGIATDGMEFVLEMLTDLSVNRGAYALRETWSNAYDATVASGDMSRRIDIIVPDPDQVSSVVDGGGIAAALLEDYTPTFTAKVIDHGIGMTYDDVKTYFTQYGGSKKRDQANQVGSKGLGAKAALAASDSFSVVSVRDGIKTTAIIERRNRKNVATLSTEDTDEQNGTTVEIPVADARIASQMSDCAYEIARYNLDANLYINGEKAESFLAKGNGYTYLGKIEIGTDGNGNPVSFRMWQADEEFMNDIANAIDLNLAGVRYQLCRPRYGYYNRNTSIIVAGDPGYLNFTPSRDEIKDDDAKSRFVSAVRQALRGFDFRKSVNDRLASFETITDMVKWVYSLKDAEIVLGADGTPCFSRNGNLVELNPDVFVKDGVDYMPLFANESDGFQGFTALTIDKKGVLRLLPNEHSDWKISRRCCKKTEMVDDMGSVKAEITLARLLLNRVDPDEISKAIIIDGFSSASDFKQFSLYDKNIRDTYNVERAFYLLVPGKFAPNALELPFYADATTISFSDAIANAKKTRRANSTVSSSKQADVKSVLGVSYDLIDGTDVLKAVVNGEASYSHYRKSYCVHVDFTDAAKAAEYGIVCGKVCEIRPVVEAASLAKAAGKLSIDKIFVPENARISNAEVDAMLSNGAVMLLDARKSVKNPKESVFASIEGVTCTSHVNRYNDRVVESSVDIADLGLDDSNVRGSIVRSMLDSSDFSSEAISAIAICIDKNRIPSRLADSFDVACNAYNHDSARCSVKITGASATSKKTVEAIKEIAELSTKVYEDNDLSSLFYYRYAKNLSEKTVAILRPGITEAVLDALAEDSE